MKEKQMETLKRKVVNEPDLKKVFEYFFDHFGEDMDFIRSCTPIQHELLIQLLPILVRELLPPADYTRTLNLRLLHAPEYNFIHGAINVDKFYGGVIYFEDIQTGVISLCEFPPSGMTKFLRFNASVLPKPPSE